MKMKVVLNRHVCAIISALEGALNRLTEECCSVNLLRVLLTRFLCFSYRMCITVRPSIVSCQIHRVEHQGAVGNSIGSLQETF